MKKFSIGLTMVFILVSSLVSFAFGEDSIPGISTLVVNGQNDASLRLYENDSLGNIVWNGARAKLNYNRTGPTFEFVLKGEGLDPNTGYSLLRSREPDIVFPNRFEVIASGTSDNAGELSIKGSYDLNMSLITAKVLLIPTQDAVPNNPITYSSKYLFGLEPINYDDTDSRLICGDNLSPGPSGWESLGLQAGDQAVDFTLYGIENPESLTEGNQLQPLTQFTLSQLLAEKPVVMIFGAFT